MKKLLIALCLSLLFSVALPGIALANNETHVSAYSTLEPFWENTATVLVSLRINHSGQATLLATVSGLAGTERITATATLVRINANGTTAQIATWQNLAAQGRNLIWEQSHNVSNGSQYRLTITATVTRNGTSETVTVSHVAQA